MNEIIDLIAKLNWYEWLETGAHWIAGEESRKFAVSRNCGWSGQQIEAMLRERGIKTWGRGFKNDLYTFHVSAKQANWAEYLIHQNSIPVYSRPVYPKNRYYAKRKHFNVNSSQKQKRPNWLESLLSFLFD